MLTDDKKSFPWLSFPWLKDIDKNLIHDYSEPYNHEHNLLRQELSITHNIYKKEIDSLKSLLKLKDERISKLIDKMITIDLNFDQLNEDYDELNLKCSLLIKSREDWIGRSLKLNYLLQEIDKIGIQQSEYILDAFKDINIPFDEIPIRLKERYIPTILTNIVELESSEDEF